jgi:hypothetical protein
MHLPVERCESLGMCDGPDAVDRPSIDEVLADPAASFLLKTALRSALCRDPVDAAHDSEILAQLLGQRCDALLSAD